MTGLPLLNGRQRSITRQNVESVGHFCIRLSKVYCNDTKYIVQYGQGGMIMDILEKNSRALADYLRRTHPCTKQEVQEALRKAEDRIDEKAKTDKRHSAAYYHQLKKILADFTERVDKSVLFEHLEDCWYYDIYFNYAGARLSLEHAVPHKEHCGDHPNYNVNQVYTLVEKAAKLLTVDEYAKLYGVETVTVRQWIRRGKLRTAVKAGREWLIPELTELPQRGYKSAIYMWYEHLRDIPEEYEFLTKYTTVLINQNRSDKNKYDVTFAAGGVDPMIKIYDTRQREKLELFLISDPRIHNIESPYDEPQNVIAGEYDYCNQHGSQDPIIEEGVGK